MTEPVAEAWELVERGTIGEPEFRELTFLNPVRLHVGMNPDFSPKFVKKYLDLGVLIRDAAERFKDEVKHGVFPGPEHAFSATSEPAKPQLYSIPGKG